ncbi:MAG: sulfatase [Fuerstiella sp.]|nr:sulfatase [Fuerstiella sp.]MCP4853709.1 sulfatase [Fuerstiella sp.]
MILVAPGGLLAGEASSDRPNVLFIAVDDLRPELGCYGHRSMKTPNIDRLATTGTLFGRAYCQQAVCNSSRASLMTGMRPDTLKVWSLETHFRDARPDALTIAQHFKAHGYHTERLGKIFHTGHGNRDDKLSWSISPRRATGSRYGPNALNDYKKWLATAGITEHRRDVRRPPWQVARVGDSDLSDGANTDTAIEALREIKDKPFFLAVGYLNPHLPFVSPKKYWDLYDARSIGLADNPDPPANAPSHAMTSWGELRKYYGIPSKGALSEQQAIKLRHGYYAAVSYIDAMIGRLLAELDRLGLRENTIVVLWGDHGWKLGEHGGWCKHTNFELDARVPLIVSAPSQKKKGTRSEALVEFVDLFPTLCDLGGLPRPNQLDGSSFAGLLDDPASPHKTEAFSQYPRGSRIMGYSMRTDRYRLTLWRDRQSPYETQAIELYDHVDDPDENVNIAAEQKGLVVDLQARMMKAGILK